MYLYLQLGEENATQETLGLGIDRNLIRRSFNRHVITISNYDCFIYILPGCRIQRRVTLYPATIPSLGKHSSWLDWGLWRTELKNLGRKNGAQRNL